ncbi:MAG TPA: serine/threonine-protein kinase [Acidimicrobiales bacterium]|nr:serine/threonine-protein kinase [Acidimicrobiales bacterium]
MSYSLLQRLGRGGMGVVDLAVDREGRPVALKRLEVRGSAEELHLARVRVRREAEVLGALHHPNIVPLLDVVDDGDDIVLVMPYLSGGTLATLVAARGPMPAPAVDDLADALLDALATAHRAGIVHRDIKPANVLFDDSGRAYLSDFGVALMRGATSGLTAAEVVVGTPEYMSPEQARGERATPASDVFSLGATLRYAATGEPPFGRGDPRVILHRAARGKVDRLPRTLPRHLRTRLAALTARRPDRRPSAAAARRSRGDTPMLGTRPMRAGHAPGGRLVPALAGAATVLLVAVIAAGVAVVRRDEQSSARPSSSTTVAPTTSGAPRCTPLPYQPCGSPPAPYTDGRKCLDDHADYDGNRADGCEAAPDNVDGTTLKNPISANLVPAGDVDRYPFHLSQHFHLFCDGQVDVTLTAPAGVSMRLEVLADGRSQGDAVSTDGDPATVTVQPDSCFGGSGADLVAVVSWVGSARSAADYVLERHGSW